jgi:hypothetical protein
MTDSMLLQRTPVYERKHSYFYFRGHMYLYPFIMDDYGNAVIQTYPYVLYGIEERIRYWDWNDGWGIDGTGNKRNQS